MRKFEKRLLLISLCLCIIIYSMSQNIPFDKITNKIEYEKIMEFQKMSQYELFIEINEWAIINDITILYSDSSEYSKIICEKIFNLEYREKPTLTSTVGSQEYGIQYNLIIDFKENRIRCKISNLNFLEFINPSAIGLYGRGIATTKINQGEIIVHRAEEFYPIEKNKNKYHEMYNFFFENIHHEIITTFSDINNYILTSDDDW